MAGHIFDGIVIVVKVLNRRYQGKFLPTLKEV